MMIRNYDHGQVVSGMSVVWDRPGRRCCSGGDCCQPATGTWSLRMTLSAAASSLLAVALLLAVMHALALHPARPH
jgi:hypothetical protein